MIDEETRRIVSVTSRSNLTVRDRLRTARALRKNNYHVFYLLRKEILFLMIGFVSMGDRNPFRTTKESHTMTELQLFHIIMIRTKYCINKQKVE